MVEFIRLSVIQYNETERMKSIFILYILDIKVYSGAIMRFDKVFHSGWQITRTVKVQYCTVQYRDGAVLQEEAPEDHERDEHGGPHRQGHA